MSEEVAARDGDRVQLTIDASTTRGTTQDVIAEIGPRSGPVVDGRRPPRLGPGRPGDQRQRLGRGHPARGRPHVWPAASGARTAGVLGRRGGGPDRLAALRARAVRRRAATQIDAYLNLDMVGSPNAVRGGLLRRRPAPGPAAAPGAPGPRARHPRRQPLRQLGLPGRGRADQRALHRGGRARPGRGSAGSVLPPALRPALQRRPGGAWRAWPARPPRRSTSSPVRRSRRPARAPRTAPAAARPRTSSTRRPG